MQILEIIDNYRAKAGFLPYHTDDSGVTRFLFCLTSNPKFGGTRFAISKGTIERGENELEAALREAEEELGLRQSNIVPKTLKLAWRGNIKGKKKTQFLPIFTAQILDPAEFGPSDSEIAETKWMTLDEFLKSGKRSHTKIVEKIAKRLPKLQAKK